MTTPERRAVDHPMMNWLRYVAEAPQGSRFLIVSQDLRAIQTNILGWVTIAGKRLHLIHPGIEYDRRLAGQEFAGVLWEGSEFAYPSELRELVRTRLAPGAKEFDL